MLSGDLPFFAPSVPETYENIVHHNVRPLVRNARDDLSAIQAELVFDGNRWSSAGRRFVSSCLCSADARLGQNGAGEVTKHPFFAGLDWTKLHKRMQCPY